MAKYIKTTLTVSSNKASATTLPGPLSVALSLTGSESLTVDNVESQIITPATGAGITPTLIFDGSTFDGTETGGTDGCYLYFKNTTSTGSNLVYIGISPARHASNDPTAPGNGGAATGLDGTSAESYRTFTLKPGEFAWLPFDYLGDVYCFANAASQQLEVWRFDRG